MNSLDSLKVNYEKAKVWNFIIPGIVWRKCRLSAFNIYVYQTLKVLNQYDAVLFQTN